MLDVKYKMTKRFLSHRWLSTLDFIDDTLRLFNCYTLLYYQFLPKTDKTTYHTILVDILTKMEIGVEARQEIISQGNELGKIQMPTEGNQRKERVIRKLFYSRDDTLMQQVLFVSAATVERVCSALSTT